ncbi:glycosyltransferase family 39 protein [Paenibacillus sp. YYML68]|uniref:glycosyltransferase family 39 protein n=1 Tax=Paenibacillus sp. YYML68 TaxID=2909250 RepID=UPI002490A2CF|nr:glycosyltransferase family 39 protein [Paenibacillus sp. YYML68]
MVNNDNELSANLHKEKREKRAAAFLFLLFAALLVWRLPYVARYAGSWDAVDFALALKRYDIFAMQPHFPGYPVFIVAAKPVYALTQDAVWSLSLVSAVFGSLSVLCVYALMRSVGGSVRASLLAAALYAVHPLISLTHVQPMSESMGLFSVLLLLAVSSLSVRAGLRADQYLHIAVWSCILYAVAMGVRISYFPLGAALLVPLWRLRSTRFGWWKIAGALTAGALTGLAWIVPVAMTEGGLAPYFMLGQSFSAGHFNDWGGAMTSATSSLYDYIVRLKQWLWDQLLWAGWTGADAGALDRASAEGISAGAASAASTVTASAEQSMAPLILRITSASVMALLVLTVWGSRVLAYIRSKPGVSRMAGAVRFVAHVNWAKLMLLLTAVVPYTIWMFWGQNPEKARHLLPLIPLLLMGAAVAVESSMRALQARRTLQAAVGAAVGLFLLTSVQQSAVLLEASVQPAPALQLVRYTEQLKLPAAPVVFTWEEERLFHYYAPHLAATRVKSYGLFQQQAREYLAGGRRVLLTSKVLDGFAADERAELLPHLTSLADFQGNPIVNPVYDRLTLYEYNIRREEGNR